MPETATPPGFDPEHDIEQCYDAEAIEQLVYGHFLVWLGDHPTLDAAVEAIFADIKEFGDPNLTSARFVVGNPWSRESKIDAYGIYMRDESYLVPVATNLPELEESEVLALLEAGMIHQVAEAINYFHLLADYNDLFDPSLVDPSEMPGADDLCVALRSGESEGATPTLVIYRKEPVPTVE